MGKRKVSVRYPPKYYTTRFFIDRARSIHGGIYDYSKTNYVHNKIKVSIICKIHGLFKQRPTSHLHGYGCGKCGDKRASGILSKSKNIFIKQANKKHNNKYNYSDLIYINNKSKVSINCPVHGNFKQRPTDHLKGSGCEKCGFKKLTSNVDDFIAKANIKHNNRYTYNNVKYINNKTKVSITCSKHKDFEQRPDKHLVGEGCPSCSLSKGELLVQKYLNDNNIQHDTQYIIPNSGTSFKYDFYLHNLNILIEYDGIQHFQAREHFGGIKQFHKQLEIDKKKNILAELHNKLLIRIPYTKYGVLEDYLLFKISELYIYCKDGKYYRNFLELCRGEKLPNNTKPKDILIYKTYKKEK